MNKFLAHILIISTGLLFGCYSFTGTNLSKDIKTFSIDMFPDEGGGPARLSFFFTEKLKNYFQQNSRLSLTKSGDLKIDGRITQYAVTPEARSGNNTAAQNRLTIVVSVNYQNTKDENASFENQTFSQFEVYEQTKTLTEVEEDLINKISEKIAIDIFNKTVATW